MTVTSCFALAAHAVVVLARRGDQGATSDFIARSASTHPARVRRVLAPLARAGLVTGHEGGLGGYILSRPSEEMTLGDVFAALNEGPIFPLHPRSPDARCPVGAGITPALEELEAEVAGAVRVALAERSVAWLAARVQVCAAKRPQQPLVDY